MYCNIIYLISLPSHPAYTFLNMVRRALSSKEFPVSQDKKKQIVNDSHYCNDYFSATSLSVIILYTFTLFAATHFWKYQFIMFLFLYVSTVFKKCMREVCFLEVTVKHKRLGI